jgi:Zn-finger nucleic acid-binding protein
MKCPVCPNSALVMTDRQGIEIDYCPSCRGVWLDRGELDKIIERSALPAAAPQPMPPMPPMQPSPYPPQQHAHYGKHHGHYKHKSWLSELFD